MGSWWASKTRQAVRHVSGGVSGAERADLAAWLTPAQLALFEGMHRADQRHGLDVVAHLRADGQVDPDLLLAGLLHDCAKGPGVRLDHRVAWSLGERYGDGVLRAAGRLPGYARAFDRLRDHPARSADLALAAGCSERTAELIRDQSRAPATSEARALHLADEAS